MDNLINIQITGLKGCGKSALMHEIGLFLIEKGHEVVCFDEDKRIKPVPHPARKTNKTRFIKLEALEAF